MDNMEAVICSWWSNVKLGEEGMKLSQKGKRSVTMTVKFWMSPDEAIHLTSEDSGLDDFHVAIRSDKDKGGGHPQLYRRLKACLKKAGAIVPAEA
jgi:hypothetical protein